MNIKKQIFRKRKRKRKREGKIRYMILRASHLRNWACDIGDFVMARWVTAQSWVRVMAMVDYQGGRENGWF